MGGPGAAAAARWPLPGQIAADPGIEDALSATKAGVEEGIVAGGFVLLQAQKLLDGSLGVKGDQATGVAIVRKALEGPLRQIAANVGEERSVIVEDVRRVKAGHGDDAQQQLHRHVQCRHRRLGQGDTLGFQNAASIAAMVLTTEAVITQIPEKRDGDECPAACRPT